MTPTFQILIIYIIFAVNVQAHNSTNRYAYVSKYTNQSKSGDPSCTAEGDDEYAYGYLIPCCDGLEPELEYIWDDYRYICVDDGEDDIDDNRWGDDGGDITGLCGGNDVVSGSYDWVWTPATSNSYSCTSPSVDSSKPKMCDNDPTSIVLQVTDAPECLVAYASDCEMSAYDITRIEADIDMVDCYGTWAAPLWLTPDYWNGGGSSGEIDMIEMCPETEVCANFAGGGSPLCYSNIDPDAWHGHMTFVKSSSGDVIVMLCDGEDSCTGVDTATYSNWYDTNACTNGQDCMFKMVSDIWIGTSGDDGYTYCSKGTYDASSTCATSVRNIKVTSSTPFTGNCAALNP